MVPRKNPELLTLWKKAGAAVGAADERERKELQVLAIVVTEREEEDVGRPMIGRKT